MCIVSVFCFWGRNPSGFNEKSNSFFYSINSGFWIQKLYSFQQFYQTTQLIDPLFSDMLGLLYLSIPEKSDFCFIFTIFIHFWWKSASYYCPFSYLTSEQWTIFITQQSQKYFNRFLPVILFFISYVKSVILWICPVSFPVH